MDKYEKNAIIVETIKGFTPYELRQMSRQAKASLRKILYHIHNGIEIENDELKETLKSVENYILTKKEVQNG